MQAAEQELGLQLTPKADEIVRQDLTRFLDSAENEGLILVLDGSDGQRGALILNTELVGAVIETMTIGRLSGATPIERQMTRTDAAIVAPLVDAVLSRLEGASQPEDAWNGFRFGATAPDLHSLGNVLDDVNYSVISLEFQVADIPYPLRFQLAFPWRQEASCVAEPRAENWSANFQSRLRQTQVSVPAVLCNVQVPFETVQTFEPGFILTVPRNALGNSALSIGNEVIARGKLGQFNGQRALKLAPTSGMQTLVAHAVDKGSVSEKSDNSAREGEIVVS